MAFRKIKAKKYNGITEYYNPKSTDKETRALYLSYRDEFGEAVKKKLDSLDKDEALIQLNNLKSDIVKAKKRLNRKEMAIKRAASQKRLTLAQVAELYFDQRDAKWNEDDRKRFNKRTIPILGNKIASKIGLEDIKMLQNKLIKDEYAAKTINETINSLRALYNVAVKKKWVDHNPVDRDENKKLEENTEPGRVLSDIELKRMFDVFEKGDLTLELESKSKLFFFAKLLYHTGARPDAVRNIMVQHCDFDQNKIHLKAMKKGKSYQQPVNAIVMKLIVEWIKKHDLKYGDSLFYAEQTFQQTKDALDKQKPAHYSGIRREGQKVFDKLFNVGIPTTAIMDRVSFYSLRRTSGTKIYKAKGIMQAMLFLNHTNVTTTQKYLNVKGEIEGIVDVL
ncbi:tyrosine-type recombinase/integrase [Sulfurovum sp. CS9]|uniref:tyrosine-type recombinase/integrase n=1 Tax=Sulfurovum sp. CS9 TaxID=3391146 RepID=UPI0039ECA412